MKTNVKFCLKCGEKTVHYLVDKDSTLKGSNGVLRGMLAICSLGISEVANAGTVERKWQCQKCDNIKRD